MARKQPMNFSKNQFRNQFKPTKKTGVNDLLGQQWADRQKTIELARKLKPKGTK